MSTTNTFTSNTPINVAVGPQNVEKRYTATEAQIEVWLSSLQSVEANCAYNEIASLVFDGELDADRLKQSIDKVVQRHASLRSTFSEDGVQVIVRESADYEYKSVDFRSGLTVELEQALQEVIIDQACTPFDLVKGPLFRVVLQQISDTKHKLTITAHHLVLDGWSVAVFCQDLGYFYDTLSGSRSPCRDETPCPSNLFWSPIRPPSFHRPCRSPSQSWCQIWLQLVQLSARRIRCLPFTYQWQ